MLNRDEFTICHITSIYSGGVITVINNLIIEQSKHNKICLIFPQEGINEVMQNCKEIIDNKNVKLIPIRKSKLFSKKILFGVLTNKVVKQLKKEYNNKLIFHFHNVASIGLLNKIKIKRSVCTIHGIDVANQKKPFYSMLYKLFFRKKIILCGVSKHTSNYYQKYTSKKIFTIYNGLETQDIKNVEYKYAIGFLGNMDNHKGWKFLYDAYEYLNDDLKNKVIFKFYGNISEQDKKYFDVHNKNLIYCGYSKNANKDVDTIDALVLPSISEGLPMSLLEAMRLSKPILATKVGGISEMLVDGVNGFFIERDSKNIAKNIEKLYLSYANYLKLSQNAYDIFNEKFQLKKIAKDYYNLYFINEKGDINKI